MIIFFQLRRVLILVLFFLLSLLMLTTRPYAQSEKLNKTEILKSLFLNKNENSSVFIQLGHSRGVQSLKVSNNGTSVLSGGEDNTVKLWDSKTGRIKKTLKGHSGIVFSVDFSPDDLMALSGSTDNTLKLWDLIQGKSVKTYRGHTGYVTAVKFFPNGQYALSGSSDKTLRLWDIREGIQIHVFEGHNDAIFSIAISSSLKHIFSGGSKGKINLWNIESGEILKTFKKGGVFWLTATKNTLNELNNLIYDLLRMHVPSVEKIEACSTIESAREMLKRVLTKEWKHPTPILIVVDDLWQASVYRDIVPDREWMPRGSSVLITYRDRRVAEDIVNESYVLFEGERSLSL